MAGEVIACNTSEDLVSPFRSLYYAEANDFGVFRFFFFFFSLEEINLHIWFIPFSIRDG